MQSSINQEILYPYYNRWQNDWGYDVLVQKIVKEGPLITDKRPATDHMLLSLDKLGFKLEVDDGRLLIVGKGLKLMNLGPIYPMKSFYFPAPNLLEPRR